MAVHDLPLRVRHGLGEIGAGSDQAQDEGRHAADSTPSDGARIEDRYEYQWRVVPVSASLWLGSRRLDEEKSPMRRSDTEEDLLDPTDAQAVVAKARRQLADGNDKTAVELLTDAAYQTRDPEIEREVRELAALGLERAGRFGKGRWKEIIRIVDSLQAFRGDGRRPLSSA
jgi:hypothetical protein